jgi:cytochrome P450
VRALEEIPTIGSVQEQIVLMRRDRIGALRRFNADGLDLGRLSYLFGDVVLVNTPELVHDVLVTHARAFEKSPILRGALHPLVGQGLFTSEGDLWRRQRKLMAPLFHPATLGRFAEDMRVCTERVVASWKDGATLDAARETTRITMAIAGRTLFGVDIHDEADELGAALTTALDWAGEESSSLTMIVQSRLTVGLELLADRVGAPLADRLRRLAERTLVPIRWPGERTRALEAALAVVDARVARLIADRRARPDASSDLLSLLLGAKGEDGTAMSDRQVRDEVVTLFVAGHETTATALAWALMLLSQHREVAERLQREVDALEGPPQATDLPRLPLALRVFKEALRLYPAVYLFGRVVVADVVIGGYLLPKGTIVLVSPYATHRRPSLWPDPDRFDPDRFLPEAEARRHRSSFIPFSAGPRTCIGNTFALMEGPIVLATILRRAELALVDPAGATPEPSATLRPKGGMPMRVRLS